MGLAVAAVTPHVLSALTDGAPVTDEQWNELEMTKLILCLGGAAQRPAQLAQTGGWPDVDLLALEVIWVHQTHSRDGGHASMWWRPLTSNRSWTAEQ